MIGADRMAATKVSEILTAMGFTDAAIETVHASANNTTLRNIALDKSGIDHITAIKLSKGWLSSFRADQTDITIIEPDIYRAVDHVNDVLPGLMRLNRDNIMALPPGRIVVQNGRYNMSTPTGLFQFLIDIIIERPQQGRRLVTATIKSNQDTANFVSEWRGWIEENGALLIDGVSPEMKLQIGGLRLTRGNGWFSLASTQAYPTLSGQIETGAATLGPLPLQNFSLTLDARQDHLALLARAAASGTPGTRISLDVALEPQHKTISTRLSASDPEAFFTYLNNALDRSTNQLAASFGNDNALELNVAYQLDKRFPGGPYPFDIRGINGAVEFLSGTFLIYPGTFDMRGSAKIAKAYRPAITDYFKIPDKVISGDYVRLDTNLAPLVSGISAGIENGAGEGP